MVNNKTRAAITGVGGYVPEGILTNAMLEQMVDTTDEWITTRTGIKERRILEDPEKASAFLAVQATKNLFERNPGIDPAEIDLVIVCTTTPDFRIGPTAAIVATEIGAVNAHGYDLGAACSGFLYGLSTAAAHIESGRYKKLLLIGAEKMSSIVDYEDRATCILFGDGAGAVLLEPSTDGNGLQDEFLRSDGSGIEYLRIKAGGSRYPMTPDRFSGKEYCIYQDGQKVFKSAVTNISKASKAIIEKHQLDTAKTWFLCHQANNRIIEAVGQKLKLDSERVLVNIHRYGNTNAGTLPLLLHDFESKFKKGDDLVFASFGAGFTWGSLYLKWAY